MFIRSVHFLPPLHNRGLWSLSWCVNGGIYLRRRWDSSVGPLIYASRAVVISLFIAYLRGASILALGIKGVRYAAGAGLLVASVLTISVVNSLSKGPGADK